MVARPLHVGRSGRRADALLRARHAVDLTEGDAGARASPVTLPITRAGVATIASAGFPLWEPLDTLQLRNHRITLAYGDLSHQLARLTARSDDEEGWNANWCTFATWSSRTIGTCIDREPEHGLIHHLVRRLPSPLRPLLFAMAEALLGREHGAIYRTLAIGNRLVFLEIGTTVSHFIDCFDPSRAGASASAAASTGASASAEDSTGASAAASDFEAYWSDIEAFLRGLRHLDPSWVATPAPDPSALRAGMEAYVGALAETDPKARAERVLLGNLLLGAYEQTRVEDYLTATLSCFTGSYLDRIMRGPAPGVSAFLGRTLAAPLSTVYARFATKFFLALEIPTPGGMVELMVGQPVPPLERAAGELTFPEELRHIAQPELQAILTRYDLSDRRAGHTRARNWASFGDRMNYITNLFRSRQRSPSLFAAPWTEAEEAALLSGRLP